MQWMPLRYNISDWHQLVGCQSNNSVDLSIHVTDFFNDAPIQGLRISVDHRILGTLFACVIDARGDLISEYDDTALLHELSIDQILQELYKFGFVITYEQRERLCGDQIQYLMTLDKLGYDKIRLLPVWSEKLGEKDFRTYVVGFKSCKHPMWLNNGYCSDRDQFIQGLEDGSAINISSISESKKYRWTWLDYVANINDIILDNV